MHDIADEHQRIGFVDEFGQPQQIDCDYIAGCDEFPGVCRQAILDTTREKYLCVYPFGWFGIPCHAPPSSGELIYARHEEGFALISTRSAQVQRMYFQCSPNERIDDWSDDRIWAELQTRTAMEGFALKEGPIFQKRMARPVRKQFLRYDPCQSASTYPAFGRSPGRDGDPRVLVLIKVAASVRHFFEPGFHYAGLTVRPSRYHHPQTSSAARADQRVWPISIMPPSPRRRHRFHRDAAPPRRSAQACWPGRR